MRADLPHAQQAVQACHALAALTHEATRRKDEHFKKWVEDDRTLVLLRVKDETELQALHKQLDAAGIIHNSAIEPDWVGGPTETALALYPHPVETLRPFVGNLQLL